MTYVLAIGFSEGKKKSSLYLVYSDEAIAKIFSDDKSFSKG